VLYFSLCPRTQFTTLINDVYASVVADRGSNLWMAFATANAPVTEKVTSSGTCSPISFARPYKFAFRRIPRTFGASFEEWFSGSMSKYLHHEMMD
jgi:hypothetical protein